MLHKAKAEWKAGEAFEHDIDGHTFLSGSSEDGQWSGPSPKKLLLAGLAGCTGVDIVDLMQKMRQDVTGISIDVEADQTEDHPKVYAEIRLVYHIFGKDIKPEKVEKAIVLSQEKLCGVTAMLQKNSPIHYRYEIHEKA